MTDSRILHESSSTLREGKTKDTFKVVLITPGKGSSGYYSEEMLKTYGPDAFPANSHSYIDHLNKPDEVRSTEKMIGVYPEGAYWEDGVGLVAELKPFSHYKQFVKEVAPYAGFSIFAQGSGQVEELDGEEVFMVEELVPHVMNSVDLVSYAGRGGHLAENLLREAMKSTHSESSAGTDKKEADMATLEESAQALVSRVDVLVTAQEAANAHADAAAAEATKVAEAIKGAVAAARAVAEAEVSDSVRAKLYTQVENGNFDVEDALAEAVELRKEIEAEVRESLKVTESFTPKTILGSFASESAKTDDLDFSVGAWKH
jgi:hypothetical protein